MKKKFILITIILIILIGITNVDNNKKKYIKSGSTTQPNNIYLNPDYVEYIKECEKGDCSSWGDIPEKYLTEYVSDKYTVLDEGYSLSSYGILEDASLEPYYNLLEISCGTDENGKIIPCSGIVKSQGSEGLCWAFATTSSLETNLLLNGVNEIFSEKQIDYASADSKEAIIEKKNPYLISGRTINSGGNFLNSSLLFQYGLSPVLETKFLEMASKDDATLSSLTAMPVDYNSPLSLENVLNFNNLEYYVSEYVGLNSLSYDADETIRFEYINELKKLIKNNGSLYVGTAPPDNRAGTCYDNNTDTVIRRGTNNCGDGKDTGHAMSIIGWDDNHEYYNAGTGKTEKGAFILKNSWGEGTDPGDDYDLNTRGNYETQTDAYSYLAYNSRFDTVYGVKTIKEKNWDNLYHSNFFDKEEDKDNNTQIYKFSKIDTDEVLKSISLVVTKGITYSVYISDSGEKYEKLGSIVSEYSGLSKLDINEEIILSNDFFIKITEDSKTNSPSVIVYTSNIDKTTKIVSSNIDEIVYLTDENDYEFVTNLLNIDTGYLSYKIMDEEGRDISEEFLLEDSIIINNKSVANLSLKDIKGFRNYVGNNYKLITKYIYEEDGEQKEIVDKKEFSIDVKKIENISLSTDNIIVYKGYNKKIYIEITPFNVLEQTLDYKVLDNSIADITEDGFVVGKSKGTTNIIVSTTDGSNISKTITLNVEEKLNGITSLSEIKDKKGGYKLLNDVVVNNSGYPSFEGTLDGNGHKIYINNDNKYNHQIFDTISNAYVTNLIIESDTIVEHTSTSGYYGTLARIAKYSIIDKIINTSDIEDSYSSSGAGETGGIIGNMEHSILKTSYNIGNITSTGSVAGLVGKTNNSIIENVFNIGKIETKAKTAYSIYNTIAAGIVSEGKNIELRNAYNIGNISAPNKKSGESIYVASIVGEATNKSTIENVYSLDFLPSIFAETDSEKPIMINAVKYNFDEMKEQEVYIGFDFNEIWEYNEALPLPVLKGVDLILQSNNNEDFAGGSGDIWNPYQISKPEHLNNVRNFNNSTFILVNDIDMTYDTQNENGKYYNSGNGWEPIENFSGIFDGNNKKIIGLNINYSEKIDKVYNLGLFANTSNSIIKNLGLEQINIVGPSNSSYYNYIGGFVGKLENSKVDTCHLDGKVSVDAVNSAAGGIAGYSSYSEINNSFNAGNITSFQNRAGGIVGYIEYPTKINKSYNMGEIIGGKTIGGIVGFSRLEGEIKDCFNIGKVVGKGNLSKDIGGVVGYLTQKSSIISSYNLGEIYTNYSDPFSSINGINGYLSQDSIVINTYNLEGVVFDDNKLVVSQYDKSVEEMKSIFTYEGFDFDNVWEFNSVYPTLKSLPFKYITDIEVNEQLITNIGTSNNLNYTIFPTDATKTDLKYNIHDTNILNVDDNGNIIGIKEGNSLVTISTTDGTYISKDINVTVLNKNIYISNIIYESAEIYDYLGGTISADVKFTEFEDTTVSYEIIKKGDKSFTNLAEYFQIVMNDISVTDDIKTTSININIPENNENISSGIYEFRIVGEDNTVSNTITFEISEYKHVDKLELNKEDLELLKGKEETLIVTIYPSYAINKKTFWSSSDENIAIVDENGKVTAVNEGRAIITVTSEDGEKSATCEVIVKEPKILLGETIINSNYNNILYEGYIGKVIIPIATQNIEENSKLTLTYYKDNIELTNIEVSNLFKISGNNVINNNVYLQIELTEAVLKGHYKIEVCSKNAEKKSFEFDVIKPILVSDIDASDITLGVNENQKVNYTITNEDALNKNVEFGIRNKDETLSTLVATVDEEGNVVGKHVGEAILTISSIDGGATKEVNVKVIERKISLSEVLLDPNPLYDYIGGKVNLTATLENIESDKVTVDVYKEGSESIITKDFTVTENLAEIEIDIPKGTTKGRYTLKVTAGEYSAEETFEVTEYIHVSSVELNKESIELLNGETDETLEVTINEDAINKKVIWSSSDENVATVDQNGKVTAVGKGPATITVTSEDGGITDTCEVTVKEPKITLGEIKFDSNYNNLLYNGYGGIISVPITRQDISENKIPNLNYYKKVGEKYQQITDVVTYNKIHNSNTIIENNISTLKFDISSELEIGEYKVEMSYENSNTIMFTFEVKEPVLINDIEISDIKIPYNTSDNGYYELQYKILPENATNKKVEIFTDSNQTIIDSSVNLDRSVIFIRDLELGKTTLTIKSLDGSNIEKTINVEVIEKSINLTETEIIPNQIYNQNNKENLYDIDGGTIKTKLTLSNINEIGLQYSLIKSDDNELNNIINKINVSKDVLSDKLILNINPNSLESGDYKFKVIGENLYESNEIIFTINEYKVVENVDVKYNNQSVDTFNIFIGRKYIELNGIINETATNKQVEWILNNDNCSISDDNSHGIFLNAEKVGQCQITFKSKEKHNSEVNLEKTLIINVIDGNSIVNDSLHQSKISNKLVDVKYGGQITNAIEFTNLNENSELKVQVFDGSSLLGIDYVEKDVILNNMSGIISLNIKPDKFNYPNEYTPSKELTVKYTYILNDIDNTELTKEYKVNLSEYNPITKINLNKTDIKLDVNESTNINSLISLAPSNATNKKVKYEISNSRILKLNGSTIIGLSEGTSLVTVISEENENIKTTINVTVENDDYLEFSNKVNIYNESGSKYLKGFNANNTYKDLMNNIDTNLNVVLKESNGTKVTKDSSILKTGMKLSVGNNNYDIVIKGDMNGDGKMSITDLSQMRYHLAQAKGKVKTGAQKLAGDMNDSNSVTITDLSQMRKKLAGGN